MSAETPRRQRRRSNSKVAVGCNGHLAKVSDHHIVGKRGRAFRLPEELQPQSGLSRRVRGFPKSGGEELSHRLNGDVTVDAKLDSTSRSACGDHNGVSSAPCMVEPP